MQSYTILQKTDIFFNNPIQILYMFAKHLQNSIHSCCKYVIKQMIKQKFGRIINISSIIGLNGNAGQINYSSSIVINLLAATAINSKYTLKNIKIIIWVTCTEIAIKYVLFYRYFHFISNLIMQNIYKIIYLFSISYSYKN